MSNPGIQAMLNGKTKVLYLHSPPSIESKLRPNLKMTLAGLFHRKPYFNLRNTEVLFSTAVKNVKFMP